MSDDVSRQDNAGSRRTRVALVFGGTSSEHGVSCLTAAGVLGALDPERYEVLGIGITRSGRWVLVDDATMAGLQVTDGRLPELSEDAADAVNEAFDTETAPAKADRPPTTTAVQTV